jgi:hypothetical protein
VIDFWKRETAIGAQTAAAQTSSVHTAGCCIDHGSPAPADRAGGHVEVDALQRVRVAEVLVEPDGCSSSAASSG